jgi:hypothetical protein
MAMLGSSKAMSTSSDSRSQGLRVLQVVSMWHSGGAERWLVDLCPVGKAADLGMDIATVFPEVGLFGRRTRELGFRTIWIAGSLRFVAHASTNLRMGYGFRVVSVPAPR